MSMFTVTLNTRGQLDAVINALEAYDKAQANVEQTPAPKTEVPKKVAKPVPKKEESSIEKYEAELEIPAALINAYTLDDAKQLTINAVKADKREAVVALLNEFGVNSTANLKPEHLAAYCQRVEELTK